MKSIKIDCDPSEYLSFTESFEHFLETFAPSLEAFEPPFETFSVEFEDMTALGTGKILMRIKPSIALVNFVAAVKARHGMGSVIES